jgi:hypothetical protein
VQQEEWIEVEALGLKQRSTNEVKGGCAEIRQDDHADC